MKMLLFYLRRYIRNLFMALNQTVSAIFLGDEDECVSSRLGKNQRGDNGDFWKWFTFPLRLLVDLGFYLRDGPNHCLQNIEEDRGDNAVFAKKWQVKGQGRDAKQRS